MLGAAVACSLSGAALLSGCSGGSSANVTPPAGAYTVRAIFDTASFVLPGLDVKVSGVKIGRVAGVELTDDNHAAVTFTIDDEGFQDFRKDASCTIRPQALIGERYVECELTAVRPAGAQAPGPLAKIAEGPFRGQRLLSSDQTYVPIDADQLLSSNTPSVRERLFIIIRELGVGVAGRGDKINAALTKSNEGLRYANQILAQLADQTEMLKQLDATSDATLASLASERSSISGSVTNGAAVAQRLANRQVELRGSIAQLSRLVTEVSPTVDKVTELTDQLEPIAEDLDASSGDLASIMNDLPTAASRGREAVTALGPTLDKGREVLTSSDTDALLDRAAKTAAGVKTTASLLGLTLGDFRATGGLDYLMDAIYGIAYSTNGRDANGHYLRAAAVNLLACALPANASVNGCRASLNVAAQTQQAQQAAAKDKSSASAARSSTPASDADSAATDLLFGGER
jgi:phospholipid/cholesterol/gamma-HCH transport system substrate-binding protein